MDSANANLSERDICTKFITPAIAAAGWNTHSQMREEVNLTAGRVAVRGNRAARDKTTTRTLRARLTDARTLQARLASALVDEVAA